MPYVWAPFSTPNTYFAVPVDSFLQSYRQNLFRVMVRVLHLEWHAEAKYIDSFQKQPDQTSML